ncbi:TetR/AcrR family transcriptional regulator C-terminal domain-containing protein [Kineococcus sp. NBC_00420]|uniref:TetR/AcrR family transcriptional regulator C-terminal domain-containing protein n=1 Tax=Kineococcus sp. NBC_00420 TaxID=2903564 RepID=UPI002E2009F8
MSKINRETVVAEALDLLDEVGLDAVSTRALARRLGVEQPSLYWHFRKKEDLLTAMSEAAMAPHATALLPSAGEDWQNWFAENSRSLRRTLLMRRDGARLHAGSFPGEADLQRITHKLKFLTAAGVPEGHARMAMLASGRYTVGCVLEEQAQLHRSSGVALAAAEDHVDHEAAFEAGLAFMVTGVADHVVRGS